MKRPDYLEQIRKRIHLVEDGSVFIPSDFFNIAEAAKVNMCLTRLVKEGSLHRIRRGIFAKPRYSELLDKNVPPYSNDIAKAIARNYGWTIIPCGDTALNMLGLSTQIPAVWNYLSDGPYKTYTADGVTLKFNHTDNKNEIIEVSYSTALVIQALKALGKNNITEKDIHILAKNISTAEKQKMLAESQRVTAWVYEYIKQICVKENSMKKIEKNQHHFQFDKNEPPILRIRSGERVCFDVMDACLDEMKSVASIAERIEKKRPSGPLHGPVYIEGAAPGDTLAVKLEKIDLQSGFQLIGPNRAIVRDEVPDWTHYNVLVQGDAVRLDNGLTFSIDPVVGTFGNAPAGKPSALEFDCGGNYDVPFVKIGSILYVPVEVPGALFSIGDVHALQGDGEIVGAPEMNASITAEFTLLPKNPLARSHLMIETDGWMHTPAYAATEFEATRKAVFNNARYLSDKYGVLLKDALVILTMLGRISVSRITFMPYFNQATALRPIVTASYPIRAVEEAIKGYSRENQDSL